MPMKIPTCCRKRKLLSQQQAQHWDQVAFYPLSGKEEVEATVQEVQVAKAVREVEGEVDGYI